MVEKNKAAYPTLFNQLVDRLLEVEKRLALGSFVQGKVVDIDEDGSRQAADPDHPANGRPMVRVAYHFTPDDYPVLSTWIPWQDIGGNNGTWTPPTVGMSVLVHSPASMQPGGVHSGIMPFWFTDKDGDKINSKAFKVPHDRRDQTRRYVEVKEPENTLKAEIDPDANAEANTSTGKPGPLDGSQSEVMSGEGLEWNSVKKTADNEQSWHRPGWDKRLAGLQMHVNNRPQLIHTADNVEKGTSTISHWDDLRHNVHAFTNTDSAQKDHTATEHQVLVKDGVGEILKPLIDDYIGGGTKNQGGGSGQNWTWRRMLKGLHWVKSLSQAGDFLERTYTPGYLQRITNKIGASMTTVTQDGAQHKIEQTGTSPLQLISNNPGKINRLTGGYLNNAMQKLVEHSGGMLKIGGGGAVGISSGGSMSVASGGVLKLAGNLVKIGGPVKIKRTFLGWGSSMPGGGGSGAVNENGTAEATESPPPDDETEQSPPPEDEYDLEERFTTAEGRLDAVDGGISGQAGRIDIVEDEILAFDYRLDSAELTLGNLGAMASQGYVEDTWTPVLAFGGTTTSVAYTTQLGHYVRLGNLVIAWAHIVITNNGSGNGAATISGLPLEAMSGGPRFVGSLTRTNNIDNTAAEDLSCAIAAGAQALTLHTGEGTLDDGNIIGGADFAIQITYMTA